MGCGAICVVLVVMGNAGGFVINRTSSDLERSINDHFGPPPVFSKAMHRVSSIHPETESSEISAETQEDSFERDFERSFKNFYRPPLLSKSHPLQMKYHKTRSSMIEKVHEDIPRGDLDINVLKSIWGAPPLSEEQDYEAFKSEEKIYTPDVEPVIVKTDLNYIFEKPEVPPESLVSTTVSYLINNETGTPIIRVDEDRFLPEDLLRTSFLRNVDEEKTTETTIMPRHATIPVHRPVIPSEHNSVGTKHLKPVQTISVTEDSLVPPKGRNSASSKQMLSSRSLLVIVPYLSVVLSKLFD